MKLNKSVLLAFGLLILAASLYRVWDGRPFGFAPQIAMAIFGGAIIKNKKLAFVLPLISLLFSDALYQFLYSKGLTTIPGFYDGQWTNYILITGLTAFGFLMKRVNIRNIAAFSVSGSLLYFITSNFFVWLAGAGFSRPKTFGGLMMCYNDGLAFYREYGLFHGFAGNILIGDLFFCSVLFGTYFLLNKLVEKPQNQPAFVNHD